MFSSYKVLFIAALSQVFCDFKVMGSVCCGYLNACLVLNQNIISDDYDLGSEVKTNVEQFEIIYNREVKFLPRNIGEKFPNLKEFRVLNCGLTVVRIHYFKNMQNLKRLMCSFNEITTLEAGAFEDLVNLRWLKFDNNLIETLDAKLFATMMNLEDIRLNDNKIKFLSPETFKIPGGKLDYVLLKSNVCINDYFYSATFDKLERKIRQNCSQPFDSLF